MSMNVTQNYSQFYKGTEPLKSYGSGSGSLVPKDTLVRYEFRTADEKGNRLMDPMTKEEALQAMKEISGQYGENVMVEFSGDGLDALHKSLTDQIKKGSLNLTGEDPAVRAEKQALLDQSIVHLENTHRRIIPNIQTNKLLYDSLENAPEHIVKAANGIINNYLLPHNVSGMTEEQRRDAIAFGLEEARYLAENYLDETHASGFMSAMETIAKYGLNGKVAEDGKVTYHIEQGPPAGAPEDYVSESDLLKEKAPELYQELQELNQRIAKGETGWGQKFLDLQQRITRKLSGPSGTFSDGKQLSYYEEAAAGYKAWKETIQQTKLPSVFRNVNYADTASFFESLNSSENTVFQETAGSPKSLGQDWLVQARLRFEKWLEPDTADSAR